MAVMIVTLLIALGCSGQVHANEFLKAPTELTERVSEEDIRISMLDEVEASLGEGTAKKRLDEITAMLTPIFTALPKNTFGNLGHSGVSYALHRLFVLRHGWVIKGLAQHSGNVSSPSGVLKDQVPSYIENMFEKRLAGKGFGLHELAVLAATIEHLIHNEAVSRLGSAFNVHQLALTSPISSEEVSEVLDTYMMAYIMGRNLNNMTLSEARKYNKQMPQVFLAWADTQDFVRGVRSEVTHNDMGALSFGSVAKITEVAGEKYGNFQNKECVDLKNTLVKMEHRGTGRVKLSDFYAPTIGGAWTFQESIGYLRHVGALDESDPDQPSVMIPNYITSAANCLGDSGFYSICCMNECEGLLGHLEQNIGAHEAKPAVIADLVGNLASSTVAAPHNAKTASLLQRLEDIAANHGGNVPLHSRSFAQWMHHMYPRECPYPHMSGTTDILGPVDYASEIGATPVATQEEMLQHIEKAKKVPISHEKHDLAVEEVMPWSHEEELLVVRTEEDLFRPQASLSAGVRTLVMLGVSSSLAFAMVQTMKTPLSQIFPHPQKYQV